MSTYSRKQTDSWNHKSGKSLDGALKGTSRNASGSFTNKYEGMSKNIEEVRGAIIPGYKPRG